MRRNATELRKAFWRTKIFDKDSDQPISQLLSTTLSPLYFKIIKEILDTTELERIPEDNLHSLFIYRSQLGGDTLIRRILYGLPNTSRLWSIAVLWADIGNMIDLADELILKLRKREIYLASLYIEESYHAVLSLLLKNKPSLLLRYMPRLHLPSPPMRIAAEAVFLHILSTHSSTIDEFGKEQIWKLYLRITIDRIQAKEQFSLEWNKKELRTIAVLMRFIGTKNIVDEMIEVCHSLTDNGSVDFAIGSTFEFTSHLLESLKD